MCSHTQKSEKKLPRQKEKRQPYIKPDIIFEGKITTRAGSPLEPIKEEFDLIKFLSGQ